MNNNNRHELRKKLSESIKQSYKDNLEVGIHCHHREGILWEPLQSADMDMCITLCENCHKDVHGIDGCGYNEMRCIR